jgi:hypothetical protein
VTTVNSTWFEDEDDRPEVLDAVHAHVEDLLAVQHRLLGSARAIWRQLTRLAASLNSPDVAFPQPESTPAVLRAMEEVVEQLSSDLIRLQALARRADDRAALAHRGQVLGPHPAVGMPTVDPAIDGRPESASSNDG